jgi:hypothetical protein
MSAEITLTIAEEQRSVGEGTTAADLFRGPRQR